MERRLNSSPQDDSRIVPKSIFLKGARRPHIYFVTSNPDKMTQARLIFSKFGIDLRFFQDAPEYVEDYRTTKLGLLETGAREIAKSVGSSSLFFLEDTSVRIEALSNDREDVPGVAIKEWFTPEKMAAVSERIYKAGVDPSASVRSDIALHVPGLDRLVFLRGETHGVISSDAPVFGQNEQYPWLSPSTFNGWIIPNGSDRVLGEMDFEESLAYDFRSLALRQLIDRLEEYAAALNLPAQAYATRSRPTTVEQPLPLEQHTSFIVVGPTCAGKTTFGERAVSLFPGTTHIEASHVMRTIPMGEDGPREPSAFERANLLMLQDGFDVVARRVLDIYGASLSEPFVITGFRTLQEIQLIVGSLPNVKVVLLEASPQTRYDRYLARRRPDDELTLERFRERDAEQEFFGLLQFAEHVADIRIKNEGPMAEYVAQISATFSGRSSRVRGITKGLSGESLGRNQLLRILRAIDHAGGPLTPTEIEQETRRAGRAVSRSSARKVLGEAGVLVRKREDGTSISYDLSPSGSCYLWLVERRVGSLGS